MSTKIRESKHIGPLLSLVTLSKSRDFDLRTVGNSQRFFLKTKNETRKLNFDVSFSDSTIENQKQCRKRVLLIFKRYLLK